MPNFLINYFKYFPRLGFVLIIFTLVSCGRPFIQNAPKGKYFLYKNNIEVKGGNFIKSEKTALIQRLYGQLDDSSKVKTSTKYVLFKLLKKPVVYDSNYSIISAENMQASMFHIGFYNAKVKYSTDTSGKKIKVNYLITTGKPTLIDSISYRFKKNDLQELGIGFKKDSYLEKNNPVTKATVITEIARLVDSFRNNGYYKFTASELKVIGDTTIEALTSLSNDPFEQLQLLAEAQEKRDSPRIKLSIVLNPPSDSSRLNKFYINKIIVLTDFRATDNLDDTSIHEIVTKDLTIKYHDPLYKTKLIERNISFKPGQLYRQSEYYKTLFNLSKAGVWQSVNIQISEVPDSSNLINLVIELSPSKKFGFEAALEVSYSAASNTSNVLAGNLFGLSGNISLQNRNLAKDAIRMTHNIRTGVEFNNNIGANSKFINSNELSYNNTTSFPRLIFPGIPNAFNKKTEMNNGESFINLGAAYNTRLNLFNLLSVNASFGWTGSNNKNWKWAWTPLNIGFSNLFNQSDSFNRIVAENPFLNYSYNTALVTGMGISFSKTRSNFYHPNSLSKEMSIRFNAEESGLTWGLLPVFNKYKRKYIKADVEIKHTIKYNKTSLAFRGFLGVGVPLLGSDTNRTLPFFKQYFGGGSNSMRAWPVRGIGPGGRPLVPFASNKTIFNDRTGDMQLEMNIEYRYDIAKIIPNTLTLRGAVFTDIGNIWNLRNTKLDGSGDSSQIQLKNLYKQIGVSAGTGLRLDFNYFVLRLDFGFRFKRPELYYHNDGWKNPNIAFDDCLKKIFSRGANDEYRKWRYENFNFTIGIGYSF